MKKIGCHLCLALVLSLPLPVKAVETAVTVRVRSHDAKFVGTGMGGVRAVLRDAATGKILDEGLVEGSTGDTRVLMQQPHARHAELSEGGAAKWVGKIDIREPARVELEVSGPLAAGSNQQKSSLTFWVLPGQDITGDGITLELNGFVVHPVAPGPHQAFKPGAEVPVEAHVVMMCGCPVEPGGLWDARDYVIKALVRAENGTAAEFPLEFTGTSNRFAGKFRAGKAGSYKIFITAADPKENNFGVGVTSIVVK